MLSGMDGYEGLTALLWSLHEDDESEYQLGGVIFEGDMPAMPEDWCALARDDFPAAMAAAATSGFGDDASNARWLEDATREACPSVEIPR